MKRTRLILFALAAGIALIFPFVLPLQWRYANEPMHATVEAVEALSAVLMALFLLHGKEASEQRLVPPALGFLAMGIMNAVHAGSPPGDQFVLLRALANLAGGLGFSLVWLPASARTARSGTWPVTLVASASLAVCVVVYVVPGSVPFMVRREVFTAPAVAINLISGMLFLAGMIWFMREAYRTDAGEPLLFSLIGFFYGLAGLTFVSSGIWTAAWWFWHVLRLAASLLVLVMLVRRHLDTITTLKAALLERRQAEHDLKQALQLTRTIIDSMNDAISLIDTRDFSIKSVNSVFLKEYGFSDEAEVVGRHCYEITHNRQNVCTAPNDICPLADTVRTGGHSVAEHIHYDRRGEKIYAEVSTFPITDEQGKVIQVVHVTRDITDRKVAEQDRERLLSDIARSNKELEQFAYVASHDLQEPLRMVSNYVSLLERKYKGRLDDKADTYIHFAVDGATRMQRLIDGLLTYSRIASRARPAAPVDLNEVYKDAVSNLSSAIRESGATMLKDDLPTVMADETQMLQLFQNLLGNAIKFRKSGVQPKIQVRVVQKGKEWTVSIHDNGIGIEQKYFDEVFKIFHRLHSQNEYAGAGIGLAVCKKIIERHGGRIWLESKPDEGTAFFFTIPSTLSKA